MLGYNGSFTMNDSHDFLKMMDDKSPRPQPRFPPIPTPFNQDRPHPTVPDVSLIFNSSSSPASLHSTSLNNSNNSMGCKSTTTTTTPTNTPVTLTRTSTSPLVTTKPTAADGSEYTVTMKLIKHLYELTKAQGKIISRMDRQMQTLHENQEKHFIALLSAVNNKNALEVSNKARKIDTEVQTEVLNTDTINDNDNGTECRTTQKNNRTNSNKIEPVGTNSSDSEKINQRAKKTIQNTRTTKATSPQQINSKDKNGIKPKLDSDKMRGSNEHENTEDLSTFLRDLELPLIQEQSLYSSADNSVGHFDLHDYNYESAINSQGAGPSVSEYETSSSEEDSDNTPMTQPTATFYRNVLGNVNRMLEGNTNLEPQIFAQQNVVSEVSVIPPFFSAAIPNTNTTGNVMRTTTDTTLYGFPSNYLSFATKQYLQRHGLINSGSPNRIMNNNGNTHRPMLRDYQDNGNGSGSGSNSDSSTNGRILDVTALKNQPKLI